MTAPDTGELWDWVSAAIAVRGCDGIAGHLQLAFADLHFSTEIVVIGVAPAATLLNTLHGDILSVTACLGGHRSTQREFRKKELSRGSRSTESIDLHLAAQLELIADSTDWELWCCREMSGVRASILLPNVTLQQLANKEHYVREPIRQAAQSMLQRWADDESAEHVRVARQHATSIDALAEFAAGAGHEINNPLAAITGRVQILLRDEDSASRRDALGMIAASALRIRDMIGDCMLFARPPEPALERLDLARTVAEVQASAAQRFPDVNFSFECDGPVTLSADPTQFAVVLHALLRNAVEAQATRVEIVIRPADAASIVDPSSEGNAKSFCEIRISDNGKGLSELDQRHLFDPFYSGRQAGRGLGFGLPKAWRIVHQHGGTIDGWGAASSGCVFVIVWPLAQDLAKSPHDESAENSA